MPAAEQPLPHLPCVAFPPEVLMPSAHKRVRGEILGGSRHAQPNRGRGRRQAGGSAGKSRKEVAASRSALLASARALAGPNRGDGGRPTTAQPRGESKEEVAAWAAARLVSTVLDARPWERPAAATAASGHATNSATPVTCTVLQRSRCSFPSALCLKFSYD